MKKRDFVIYLGPMMAHIRNTKRNVKTSRPATDITFVQLIAHSLVNESGVFKRLKNDYDYMSLTNGPTFLQTHNM